jgi:hypothetical protein
MANKGSSPSLRHWGITTDGDRREGTICTGPMQQHRQFARNRDHRLFLPILPPRSASFNPHRLRSLSAPNGPRIWCAPWTSNLRRYRSPSLLMCRCGSLPRVPPSRLQPDIAAHIPALAKTMRIFERQHIGQRDQRHFLHPGQSRHFRVTLLRDLLNALAIFPNPFAQRLDLS